MDWIGEILGRLRAEELYRERILSEGLKDFCSNDYLGFRSHPEVISSAVKALEESGLGSAASQLISGYTRYHRKLEEALARFKGTPACVLFGSGYLANLGTVPLLAGEGDLILSDELNHASLIDACRLSRAERKVFPHRDYGWLRDFLRRRRRFYNRVLILTDGIFSMDGDMADLPELYRISEDYDCLLYVDDAHGTGTVGGGRGVLAEAGLRWRENVVLMGTLSKALGSYGAFVCGSRELVELLVNRARSLIFSTSPPPPLCAGALKAVELIEKDSGIVEGLRRKAEKAYSLLRDLPFRILYHGTPIIPIVVGEEREAVRISRALLEKGVLLRAVRYPTVPRGSARLRLTVSLRHSEEDLEELAGFLRELSGYPP